MGAKALFMDDVGSLERGKLADVITIDAGPVHNMPQFDRDPNAIYSRIVYASKSNDVRHVICNGDWLMRDRNLLTIDEAALLQAAAEYAVKVDGFLAVREKDILRKLLAIGGLEQGESFEVQVKAILKDEHDLENLLQHSDVEIVKSVHYRQYDTYFLFDDPAAGRVRYREDDMLDEQGNVKSVRSRLTYTTTTKERDFHSAVVLSRSRFISKADRPLRFYREYFQPHQERELQKDRRRWHILYQGVLFYVNLDRVIKPDLNEVFVEIKSRTWSLSDAENKADRIKRMLDFIGVGETQIIRMEYLEFHKMHS